LVEDFAQVRTAADALEFVQVFGFLNLFKHDDPLEAVIKQHHEGEEVDHILVMATSIREFLDEAVKGPRAVYRMLVDHGGMLMINVELALVPDHRTKSARMRYSIWSLYRAIVLQMCASVTEEGEYRLCLFHKCGRHFLASPEADRNRNSKFCCTNHRIAYNSLNRSKGS
jgi:hypothetical protein